MHVTLHKVVHLSEIKSTWMKLIPFKRKSIRNSLISEIHFHLSGIKFHLSGIQFHSSEIGVMKLTFHLSEIEFHLSEMEFHLSGNEFHLSEIHLPPPNY